MLLPRPQMQSGSSLTRSSKIPSTPTTSVFLFPSLPPSLPSSLLPSLPPSLPPSPIPSLPPSLHGGIEEGGREGGRERRREGGRGRERAGATCSVVTSLHMCVLNPSHSLPLREQIPMLRRHVSSHPDLSAPLSLSVSLPPHSQHAVCLVGH